MRATDPAGESGAGNIARRSPPPSGTKASDPAPGVEGQAEERRLPVS